MNENVVRAERESIGRSPEETGEEMAPRIVDLAIGVTPRRRKPTDPNDLPLTATIIALDPGGTTGWSLMSVHPESLLPDHPEVGILNNIEEHLHGEIRCDTELAGNEKHYGNVSRGEAEGIYHIAQLLDSWPGACVVVEDFTLSQFDKGRDLLSPVRITAAINQHLWQRQRYIFLQDRSFKKVATDERLKNWGLYQRTGGLGHARDGDRHAIAFLRRASGADGDSGRRLREEAWPHLYGPGRPYATEEMSRSELLSQS